MGKFRNLCCEVIFRNYVNINCDIKVIYKYRVYVDICLFIYVIYDIEFIIIYIVG